MALPHHMQQNMKQACVQCRELQHRGLRSGVLGAALGGLVRAYPRGPCLEVPHCMLDTHKAISWLLSGPVQVAVPASLLQAGTAGAAERWPDASAHRPFGRSGTNQPAIHARAIHSAQQ